MAQQTAADPTEIVTDPDVDESDVQASADIIETEAGEFRSTPPTLRVEGDVPEAIVTAVAEAVRAEMNTLDAPKLWGPEAAPRGTSHTLAVLTARFNETPVTEGGELVDWLPPYRAREDFDAALREELPDDVMAEAIDNGTTGFYRD